MFIYSWSTGWQPNEPWVEVFVGVTGITMAGSLFIRYRTGSVNRILRDGLYLEGEVERYHSLVPA